MPLTCSLLVRFMQIDLSQNMMQVEGGKAIAAAIAVSPSLTQVCPTLDASSPADCSRPIFVREPPLSYPRCYCIQIDLSYNIWQSTPQVEFGRAIAEAIAVSRSLTQVLAL